MTTIDKLDDFTLEKFQFVVERLNVIRNEKIWKNFKLRDAEFLLNDIKDNCAPIFLPIVRFHELEIQCLRWALCPTELLILEVEANSRELSKNLHQISKQFSRVPPATKAGKVFAIEYRLMEAEVLMICAAIDFQKRNFITAAHTMVKSNDIFLDLAQVIDELRGKSDEALKTDGFISLCQKHLHGEDSVPEELLQNLRKLIDERTSDIRRRHNDRHSAVPEEILEATRSLLQLKQLYADLSGKWRSSDGHKEIFLQNNSNQPNIPKQSSMSPRRVKSMTSLVESVRQVTNIRVPATPRSPDSDDEIIIQDEEECDKANMNDDAVYYDENSNILQNVCSPPDSPYPSSKTPSPQKLQQKYNISPFKQSFSSKSPVKRIQTRSLEAKFAIESPQKISVNTVTSILPRMFSFSKFFPGYSQQQATSLKQIHQRRNSCTEQHTSNKTASAKGVGSTSGASQRRRSVYEDNRDDTYDDEDKDLDVEIDVVDFQGLFASSSDDFQEQQLVNAMSRVHFAVALRNLLFANSPKQLKWMLSILKLIPNVTQSIVTLYQIHNFEEARWGPIATLILLNMPTSVFDNAMKECGDNHVHQYLPINSWDQLHSLVEAQSMLAPWTSKNPLWLSTVARSVSAKICTNSMTRLDFYRRSLASEEDAFSSGSPYGYFSITSMVSKHFLSLGHWTKSYNTSRLLYLNPMVRKNMQLESLGVQVAAAAAASCCELFGSQNKYLHLKFSDQIILNSGAASLVEVAENGVVTSTSASNRFRNGNMGSNQHFHLGISQFLSAFCEGGMALTLDDVGNYSTGHSSGDSASSGKAMEKQAENNLRGRLLHYHQILDISETVDPWKDDSEALLRATGFWLWLLPIEFLYLMSMKDSFTQDALHNQMLQLCDKGAALFADRYLPTHLAATVSENSSSRESHSASMDKSNRGILGPLIKSIIVDNVADADPAMARRSLLLIKKVNIVQEQILFSGQSHLRLDLDERTGIIANSALENLIVAMQPNGPSSSSTSNSTAPTSTTNPLYPVSRELKHVETQTALRCIKKIQARLEKIKQKLEQGEETAGQYLLDMPTSAEKVYGDIVVTWLLCRGLILKKLNRIWEAVLMFKLIEVCKDMAPRSKFAVFSAYTELAEIILDYEVCEEPLILAAEYLKRGCVAMRRVFETGYLPYVHEYRRKMKVLADRLDMLH